MSQQNLKAQSWNTVLKWRVDDREVSTYFQPRQCYL